MPFRFAFHFCSSCARADTIICRGRTGRMGRRGRGIVLVGKDDRKDVVREVREGMYRGASLL